MLEPDAPPAFVSEALYRAGVKHGFFGRRGGVSTGIYASLNAGPGSRDDQAAIAENRRRIAAAFGASPDKLVSLHQVHSPTVLTIDAPIGRPQADGLVTKTPGLVLTALAADCAPVLFADPVARVIGSAHAGWRGAIGGVIEATVAAMRALGAEPARMIAAVGPCIHQKSYEVGPEFEAQFRATDAAYARYFAPGDGDRFMFDLPGFCADRLRAQGIGSVDIIERDTRVEDETLFSHRRSVANAEPDYGRNCAAIAL